MSVLNSPNPETLQLLSKRVNSLIEFARKQKQGGLELSSLKTALKKATSPRFEVVFAGAFSAGKSMLINALLGQELLYSSEGHATGTECYIEYSEPGQERVELTFLTRQQVSEEAEILAKAIAIPNATLEQEVILNTIANCERIIEREGGRNKSEAAKKANALQLLLQGFQDNQKYIRDQQNYTLWLSWT
jgi:hypothetical protein